MVVIGSNTALTALTATLAVLSAAQARPATVEQKSGQQTEQPLKRMAKVLVRSTNSPPLPKAASAVNVAGARRSMPKLARRAEASVRNKRGHGHDHGHTHEHIHVHDHDHDHRHGHAHKHVHVHDHGHKGRKYTKEEIAHHSKHWAKHHGLAKREPEPHSRKAEYIYQPSSGRIISANRPLIKFNARDGVIAPAAEEDQVAGPAEDETNMAFNEKRHSYANILAGKVYGKNSYRPDSLLNVNIKRDDDTEAMGDAPEKRSPHSNLRAGEPYGYWKPDPAALLDVHFKREPHSGHWYDHHRDHGHGHEHDHDHEHIHEHIHEHKREAPAMDQQSIDVEEFAKREPHSGHWYDHHRGHGHNHGHGHDHSHGHDHDHEHIHEHIHEHKRDATVEDLAARASHSDHRYDHHDYHGHGHDHDHDHDHAHIHEHAHEHKKRGLLTGAIKPLLAPLNAIPGFVTISDLLLGTDTTDGLVKKVASLVLHAEPAPASAPAGSAPFRYSLMASKSERTQIWLVPTDDSSTVTAQTLMASSATASAAPPFNPSAASSGSGDGSMIVKVVVPLLNTSSSQPMTWCATFNTTPPSPLQLQPCANATTILQDTPTSQRFSYTPSSGALAPLYAKEWAGNISSVADGSTDGSATPPNTTPLPTASPAPAPPASRRQAPEPAADDVDSSSSGSDTSTQGDDSVTGTASTPGTTAPLSAKANTNTVTLKFTPAGIDSQGFQLSNASSGPSAPAPPAAAAPVSAAIAPLSSSLPLPAAPSAPVPASAVPSSLASSSLSALPAASPTAPTSA